MASVFQLFVIALLSVQLTNGQFCSNMQQIFNKQILPQAVKNLRNLKFNNVEMDLVVATVKPLESKIQKYKNTQFRIVQSKTCTLRIQASAVGKVLFSLSGDLHNLDWKILGAQMQVFINQKQQVSNVQIIWGNRVEANIDNFILDNTVSPFFGQILENYKAQTEKYAKDWLNNELKNIGKNKQTKLIESEALFLLENIDL